MASDEAVKDLRGDVKRLSTAQEKLYTKVEAGHKQLEQKIDPLAMLISSSPGPREAVTEL